MIIKEVNSLDNFEMLKYAPKNNELFYITPDEVHESFIKENERAIIHKELLDKYDYELRKLFEYTDFICEHGNDKTSTELREMLDSINKELALIEEKEQGTTIKDTVNKIKKRTR